MSENSTPQQSPVARVGQRKNASLLAVKWALRFLRFVSPEVTAKFALKLFLTPPKHKPSTKERNLIGTAVRHQITVAMQEVVVYQWGTAEKTVLLCHAWADGVASWGPLSSRCWRAAIGSSHSMHLRMEHQRDIVPTWWNMPLPST